MAIKKIGISRDLVIHPGETIADVLEDRGITQAELAARTGVSPAYISSLISGKKNISTKFAMSLEYALNVPKSFWLNLQANYDAELLELNESQTVTEAEKKVCQSLTEIIKYLRKQQLIPVGQKVGEPHFVGPDISAILRVQDIFYPDFPMCGHPDYSGKRCIAESCQYAVDGDWTKCPYFTGYEIKEDDHA